VWLFGGVHGNKEAALSFSELLFLNNSSPVTIFLSFAGSSLLSSLLSLSDEPAQGVQRGRAARLRWERLKRDSTKQTY
jgi:hypothetical protein